MVAVNHFLIFHAMESGSPHLDGEAIQGVIRAARENRDAAMGEALIGFGDLLLDGLGAVARWGHEFLNFTRKRRQ